jgi:hypothetical protein
MLDGHGRPSRIRVHQSLSRFDVPAAETQEIVAIVESTKDDIVVAAPQSSSRRLA